MTGLFGVCILWVGEIGRQFCKFYLSVEAGTIVKADLSRLLKNNVWYHLDAFLSEYKLLNYFS